MDRTAIAIIALFVALTGCSQESGLAPVNGKVTFDGEPLKEMMITFTPTGQTEGNGAMGYVGNDGTFSLIDMRGEPGAYAGQYRISFYPADKLPADDPASVIATPRTTGLPGPYLNPNNSPVTATVPPEGATIEVLLTKSGEGATTKTAPYVAAQ
jgi:hypothetical protein